MDKIVTGFLERNLPEFKNDIIVSFERRQKDYYVITCANGKVYVKANNYISAFHGIYEYLKKYCNVQLSWCANTEINIKNLVMFEGEFSKVIEQKYRVYM
ncbi:MAG: alpha-N-acetylglucosaminidase N-terminal domain-containing protein, partial [Ruminococcus sp.]